MPPRTLPKGAADGARGCIPRYQQCNLLSQGRRRGCAQLHSYNLTDQTYCCPTDAAEGAHLCIPGLYLSELLSRGRRLGCAQLHTQILIRSNCCPKGAAEGARGCISYNLTDQIYCCHKDAAECAHICIPGPYPSKLLSQGRRRGCAQLHT